MGSHFLNQGSDLPLLHRKCRVLTTGPGGHPLLLFQVLLVQDSAPFVSLKDFSQCLYWFLSWTLRSIGLSTFQWFVVVCQLQRY